MAEGRARSFTKIPVESTPASAVCERRSGGGCGDDLARIGGAGADARVLSADGDGGGGRRGGTKDDRGEHVGDGQEGGPCRLRRAGRRAQSVSVCAGVSARRA